MSHFFGAIMEPLYWVVSWVLLGFHSLLSNFMDPDSGWTWALAIVMLTVLIRTLLIPLFVKQIRSSRNMQLLTPKLQELKQKYGHDQNRLGQETMKLYKEEGVNPMASCLPLLLQMPIFISLFWVLRDGANGIPRGVFHSNPEALASMAKSTLLGAKISGTFLPFTNGWEAQQTLTAVLIVGMTVMLFITQLQLMRKNMPPEALTGQAAQTQKIMLYTFPIMYLFFGVSIPVGVLLYWFVSNLWTLVQQWIMIHTNPAKGTPAYIDWADRMRAKGLDPDEVYARRSGKKSAKRTTTYTSGTGVQRQRPGADNGAGSGSGVRRQGVARQGADSVISDDDTDNGSGPIHEGKKKIQRQQLPKQSRAARRKGRSE